MGRGFWRGGFVTVQQTLVCWNVLEPKAISCNLVTLASIIAVILKSQTWCLSLVRRGEGWKENIVWKPEHKFIGFITCCLPSLYNFSFCVQRSFLWLPWCKVYALFFFPQEWGWICKLLYISHVFVKWAGSLEAIIYRNEWDKLTVCWLHQYMTSRSFISILSRVLE